MCIKAIRTRQSYPKDLGLAHLTDLPFEPLCEISFVKGSGCKKRAFKRVDYIVTLHPQKEWAEFRCWTKLFGSDFDVRPSSDMEGYHVYTTDTFRLVGINYKRHFSNDCETADTHHRPSALLHNNTVFCVRGIAADHLPHIF